MRTIGLMLLVAGVVQAPVALLGKISVKGNMPFVYTALTTQDGRVFRLEGEKAQPLRNYQGSWVFVWGEKEERGERGKKMLPLPAVLTVTAFEKKP